MATPLDLTFPKIASGEFHQAWTHFELVASAKEWNDKRKKLVFPTLLGGKLVEYYMEVNEMTHGNLANLKTFLITKVGLAHDPFMLSQLFMSRSQQPGERILDYVADLTKLFTEAYPSEYLTSAILLQQFITGLLPPICHQLLLQGKPETLAQAVKDTANIEYVITLPGKLTITKKL